MAYRDRFPINNMVKEADASISSAKERARELLSMPEYVKYKEQSDKEVADILKFIREYKNADPTQYAFVMQGKIKELNEREWLVKKIESDAGENRANN